MISELQITAARRATQTYLQHCYFTRPFKVADISGPGAEALHLTLMSASPGILDGDAYEIQLKLEPGAQVHLYTQSYQRIFKMQEGARQHMQVQLAEGSSLYYLPHPTVPHEQSVFNTINHITLAADCRLLWGEIITCGRKLSGEVFRCRHFGSTTSVYRDKKLVFKDVTLVQPAEVPPGGLGQWEGYTHQASLLWHDDHLNKAAMADEIHALLTAEDHLAAAVSQTAAGALLVRALGQGGEQLYTLFKKIALLAGQDRKL